MAKRLPKTGLSPQAFEQELTRQRLQSAHAFLPRSATFAACFLPVFWVLEVVRAPESLWTSLCARLAAAALLLGVAWWARKPRPLRVSEWVLCVVPMTLILCIAAVGFLGTHPLSYAGSVGLMIALAPCWIPRRRTFVTVSIITFTILVLMNWQSGHEFAVIYWLNILLGGLCAAFYLDLLRRLAHRGLRLQLELKTESRTDALTGLPNRRAFLETAEDALNRALRRQKHIAVIIIDADHFKAINDQRGHDVGDAVLQTLAAALANAVGGPDRLGRLGGEEFAYLIGSVETPTQVIDEAERLCSAIRNFDWKLEDLPSVTASMGAAISRSEGDNFGALLKRADVALYRAKAAGRDRVEMAGD